MIGMIYWAKINGIEIDTAVLFFKLSIEEMVKTNFTQGGPVAMYKRSQKLGFHHLWWYQGLHKRLSKILGGKMRMTNTKAQKLNIRH